MASTINASTSSGIVSTADTSGTLELQSAGTTKLTVASTGVTVADNLSFNSGYGSSAVAYGCRAWVAFNGTGTIAIYASGNVTSITDGGTGIYSVVMTNAMPDSNYAVAISVGRGATNTTLVDTSARATPTTTTFSFAASTSAFALVDANYAYASVFR